MNIRRANLFDLTTLWELYTEQISEEAAKETIEGRVLYPEFCLTDREAWSIDTAINLTNPNCCILLAEISGQAVGHMVTFVQTRSVGAPKQFAYVNQLYVRPAERKRALGSAAVELCAAAEQWVRDRGITAIEIDAVESNRKLWEGRGFTASSIRLHKELS